MSVWKSYLSLTPQKKAILGLGLITWSAIGMFVTDRAEKRFGLEPTDKETAELKRMLPSITTVDKPKP